MNPTTPLLHSSPYGGFDPETFDYVFSSVRTPRPWSNVLANERYGAVLSQAGGGFSWYGNCQLFRLNRWDQDLVRDGQGRFLYFGDGEEVWSSTLQPCQKGEFEARHGLGFSHFANLCNGIRTAQTVFVPVDLPCEAWVVEATNTTDSDREVQVGFLLDWLLGGPGDWHHEFFRLFAECSVEGDTTFAWKHPELREHSDEVHERPERAFVRISGLDSIAWTTDKADFLGRLQPNSQPKAMLDAGWQPSRSGRWDDPVAAAKGSLHLAPGQTRRFVVMIGADDSLEAARDLAAQASLEWADAELERAKAFWKEHCTRTQLRTGDTAVDIMFNAWLPYQAYCGRMLARCAYYQQGGAYGYRDQLQDSLSLLMTDPELTLAQLVRHAEAMYEDGGVRHWWHPGTEIFSVSRHSDTCLWLSFGLQAYLEETNDLDALGFECSYLSRETQQPSGTRSLLEHALTGISRALSLRSARGLPLLGAGDWNDGLSHAGIKGQGESVWMGMFLYHVMQGWIPILNLLGRSQQAQVFAEECASLKKAVNDHGWDGEWFVAGFDDSGRPFGSQSCTEGRIFLMPNIWAVITGIADPERQDQALESVRRRLLKPYGPLLLAPAYSKVDPGIGYITRYAPGLRENGGVYTHAACWAVQAFAMKGDLETALEIVRGMMPPLRSEADPDLYAAEPYVMPGNSDGPDSPFESRAGWTWYTGSAAWMRRMILEWLGGVRAAGGVLDTGLDRPKAWDEMRVSRWHKGEAHRLR